MRGNIMLLSIYKDMLLSTWTTWWWCNITDVPAVNAHDFLNYVKQMRKLLRKSMIIRYIYSNRIRTLFDVFSRGNSPKVSPHNEFSELSIAVYTIKSKLINWQKQDPCLATV